MLEVKPKHHNADKNWYLIDAQGKTLGRMSTMVALHLTGKNKPEYLPYLDTGSYVVVINASKIHVTGNKLKAKKYYHHTGYQGGIKEKSLEQLLASKPTEVILKAVKGMLPKGVLGRQMLGKLKVYAGSAHPHLAQKPILLV